MFNIDLIILMKQLSLTLVFIFLSNKNHKKSLFNYNMMNGNHKHMNNLLSYQFRAFICCNG